MTFPGSIVNETFTEHLQSLTGLQVLVLYDFDQDQYATITKAVRGSAMMWPQSPQPQVYTHSNQTKLHSPHPDRKSR